MTYVPQPLRVGPTARHLAQASTVRFIPDEPDIPDGLVTAQQRGQVLFVCGASVSRNAGLPLFNRLVECIYATLGEIWAPYPGRLSVCRGEHGRIDIRPACRVV